MILQRRMTGCPRPPWASSTPPCCSCARDIDLLHWPGRRRRRRLDRRVTFTTELSSARFHSGSSDAAFVRHRTSEVNQVVDHIAVLLGEPMKTLPLNTTALRLCAWSGPALVVLFFVGLVPLAGFIHRRRRRTAPADRILVSGPHHRHPDRRPGHGDGYGVQRDVWGLDRRLDTPRRGHARPDLRTADLPLNSSSSTRSSPG